MEGGGSPTVRVVGDHELIGYVKDPYVGLLTDKVDVAGHDPVGLHGRLPPARDRQLTRGSPRCPRHVEENRPPREIESLQQSVEAQKGRPPQVQVLCRPQLKEPGGESLVEASCHGFRRTRQKRPGGRLQDTETLISQVPQQEIRARGHSRQLCLQVSHHVRHEGTTSEWRCQQGQVEVSDVGWAPRADEGLTGDVALHAPPPVLHLTRGVPGHAGSVDRDSSCHRAVLNAHGHTPRACR